MTVNVTYDFSGQVAVITGAARGVGRALVESFAAAGAHVVAADRDEPGLAQTCAPYRDAVLAVTADVSTEAGATHIIDAAAGRFLTNGCVFNRLPNKKLKRHRVPFVLADSYPASAVVSSSAVTARLRWRRLRRCNANRRDEHKLRPFLGVGGLDQRFEHVERDGFDAVADREFVALGEFLDRRHQPRQELVVRLDRRAGARE